MASVVPYTGTPTVGPQLAPTPYARNQPPPGAFGELTAQATEHLGQAVSQAGSEVFERANAMQLLDQQAAADSAASDFQMKMAKAHTDYGALQGKDAADGLNPMLQGVEDTRGKIRQGLSSPYAQMQYDRDTRRMQGQMLISAATHADAEQKKYLTGSLQARLDTAKDTALSLPQDDEGFKASLNDVDRIADQMRAQGGWSQDQRDGFASSQKSGLTANRIEGIAKTDQPTALRMQQQAIADKTLIGQDIANTTNKINYALYTTGARTYANRILSGEGSVAGGGPVPLGQAATTIGQYISKDNYDYIGTTHDGKDRAIGRYGVPAGQLSGWLKEADMPDMTEAEFVKSHSAQDNLFNNRFGKLQDGTQNFNDALKLWTLDKATPVAGSGTGEQRQAFSMLKGKGWSDDMAHAMVATLSGESGSHLSTMANQTAGGRNWESRFESQTPDNGVANWDQSRTRQLDSWAKGQGMNPNKLETQIAFVDHEARQMGFDPSKTGDPRGLTMELTGSSTSGQGYEKPAINNGGERWARYSGQRYANDPVIQQVNGLLAHNTPLDTLVETGKAQAAQIAPNSPLFADYLTDRIQGLYRQQAYRQQQDEAQNKQTVDGALLQDDKGAIPTSVEELRQRLGSNVDAYDHAKESDKLRWNGVLAKNLTEGGVDFTPESFKQYWNLHAASIDPSATPQERQALLDANISDLNMPLKARQELFKNQLSVYKQEEASPQMTHAMKVLEPILPPGLNKKSDPDNYNLFQGQLHDAIQEHNHLFAKPLNDDDVKQIGTQLLRDKGAGHWYSSTIPWYTQGVPEEYSAIIKSDPRWKKVGIDPTDEMIRTMFVKQQFENFYAGAKK